MTISVAYTANNGRNALWKAYMSLSWSQHSSSIYLKKFFWASTSDSSAFIIIIWEIDTVSLADSEIYSLTKNLSSVPLVPMKTKPFLYCKFQISFDPIFEIYWPKRIRFRKMESLRLCKEYDKCWKRLALWRNLENFLLSYKEI